MFLKILHRGNKVYIHLYWLIKSSAKANEKSYNQTLDMHKAVTTDLDNSEIVVCCGDGS